jgi:hypothetical protein
VSHPGPGPGAEDPAVQVQTTIPAGGQVAGVYAVLEGVAPGNALMGGYGYLQWSDAGGCWHEALDLNSMGGGDADLGARVVAPVAGLVTEVLWWNGAMGFGNHLAVWLDDAAAAPPCYLHVAHLDTMVVRPGERVAAGQPLGTCGKSGLQPYAHVHTALWKTVPPGGWDFWQTGYSKAWVAEHTHDPADWFWASVAKAQGAPEEAWVAILSGAQAAAVQAVVWGDWWEPAAADFAIPTAWRDEWRRGVWRGAPLAREALVPEDAAAGKPAGSWQRFQYGAAVWLPGQPVSWNG